MTEEKKPLTLGRDQRIRRSADFDAVYEVSVRRNAGPMLVYVRGNELGWSRLGMAVSRRVGNSVSRNSIRRRIREAFRLAQHEIPRGYDIVVSVRAHQVMKTSEYRRLLLEAMHALHARWRRKAEQSGPHLPPGP